MMGDDKAMKDFNCNSKGELGFNSTVKVRWGFRKFFWLERKAWMSSYWIRL